MKMYLKVLLILLFSFFLTKTVYSKITYKEILDNPIDLELNLNYAKQQEQALGKILELSSNPGELTTCLQGLDPKVREEIETAIDETIDELAENADACLETKFYIGKSQTHYVTHETAMYTLIPIRTAIEQVNDDS